MAEANFMMFFLTDEGGTSSLLATALDPQIEDDRQLQFQHRFCDRLRSCGVELSPSDRPLKVYREHADIDLVLIWGNWIILLENKVPDASVTRNQLNKYYRAVLKAIERGSFLQADYAGKCICVVYLTPTETSGDSEFQSLELDAARQDKKAHLSWNAILDDLRKSFVERDSADAFGKTMRLGCDLTHGILTERGKRARKTVETPERIATKEFLKEVRDVVMETMQSVDPIYKLTDWNAPDVDELYGNIGGDFGNVYLSVFPNDTRLLAQDEARLNGSIWFKIAGKAKKERHDMLHKVAPGHWTRLLGISRDLKSEPGDSRLVLEQVWEGKRSEIVDKVAGLFCRFLLTFRPFMVAPLET